jgi:hypothetical protein
MPPIAAIRDEEEEKRKKKNLFIGIKLIRSSLVDPCRIEGGNIHGRQKDEKKNQ